MVTPSLNVHYPHTMATREATRGGRRETTHRTSALVAKDLRGEIRIDAKLGVATTEVRGHIGQVLAEWIFETLHGLCRQGTRVALHDWTAMTGCDPSARELLGRIMAEHILSGSSLVGMGSRTPRRREKRTSNVRRASRARC